MIVRILQRTAHHRLALFCAGLVIGIVVGEHFHPLAPLCHWLADVCRDGLAAEVIIRGVIHE